MNNMDTLQLVHFRIIHVNVVQTLHEYILFPSFEKND